METKAREVVDALLGCATSSAQWLQIQLPGPLGGCGGRLPSTVAPVAYAAAFVAHRATVVRNVMHMADVEAVDVLFPQQPRAEDIPGLRITDGGQVVPTTATLAALEASPLLPAVDIMRATLGFSKLISRALRIVESCNAATVEEMLRPEVRERFYAAAGPESGILWTEVPSDGMEPLPDTHWRCATRARLSCEGSDQTVRCCHKKEGSEQTCGSLCGKWGHHAAVCTMASARLRAHRQMVHALAAIMKRAGAEVDIERAVPEWHGRGPKGAPEEAIMDVVIRWPGTNELHFVDVTVRAPWSGRYTAAQTVPGSAAETAWKEKHRRYPAVNGVKVTPMVFECLGRMHGESAKWLRCMASDAATRSGRPRAGRTMYRRWRTELDRALVYVEADVLLTSMGGGSSRFLARRTGGGPGAGGSERMTNELDEGVPSVSAAASERATGAGAA